MRRKTKNGIAELVLMGAANPRRQKHDKLWHLARRALKTAGSKNPRRWDRARDILTGGLTGGRNPSAKRYRVVELDANGKELVLREGITRAAATAMVARLRATYGTKGIRYEIKQENPAGDAVSLEKGEDAAADKFEEFHGKSAEEVIEVQESDTIRKTYTALGDLIELRIAPLNGRKLACVKFPDVGVKLACDPAGRQLYLIGGDQNLDGSLDVFGSDASKDLVELGRCVYIEYQARKSMNGFSLVNYYHELGEESGDPPIAFYNQLQQRIYLAGGRYHVEAPGIID